MHRPTTRRRRYYWLWLLLALPMLASAAMRVTFINPASASQPFWLDTDQALQAAAAQLAIKLTIVHAQGDKQNALHLAQQIIDRRSADYVLAVNVDGVGPEFIRLFNQAKIPIMLVLSDLGPAQLLKMGPPRQRFPYWLGSLTPDNLQAGEQVAAALAAKMQGQNALLAAIAGDRVTPAGLQRQAGLLRAIRHHGGLHLAGMRYGFWQQRRSERQMRRMLKRHPNIKLVWAANDTMAKGAIAALKTAGLTPGRDVFVGTFGNAPQSLRMLRSGELSVLATGHFLAPAYALTLLFDYQHGVDFGRRDGLQLQIPLFHLMLPGTDLFNWIASRDWQRLNFRAISNGT